MRLRANRVAYTLTILVTLAVGILIGTVVSYGVKGKEAQKSSDVTPLTVPAPQQLSSAFSQIAKQLEPSVVNINTESTIKNPHRRGQRNAPGGSPDDDNPFEDSFDRFCGGQGGRAAVEASASICWARCDRRFQGYIVTNRHVVEKADRVRVRLQNDSPGVLHDAKVIGSDRNRPGSDQD